MINRLENNQTEPVPAILTYKTIAQWLDRIFGSLAYTPQLFALAESLGGVESLICHPPTMTHASVPAEVRRKVGIGDGLLRFSVGIEDVADLKADIDRALDIML